MPQFLFKIKGEITVTAETQSDAEDRIMRARERLEETVNNVEVDFVEEQQP